MIEVQGLVTGAPVAEAVLFPFDDHAIPFAAGLRLHLVPGKAPGRPNPIVLRPGPEGAPDDERVRFYGTVIPAGDELHMWYLGGSRREPGVLRACYAVSREGEHWVRPDLGLVTYAGSRANNLLDFPNGQGGILPIVALPVLHDPEDPDPQRRFKCAFESPHFGTRLAVAFSADGLRWTVPAWNPVGFSLEQTGLVRFNGAYFVNGQGGRHFGIARKLVTFASYDFQHWTPASSLGFRRDAVPPRAMETKPSAGEEVHLGAGLWNRGNVLLGVYDAWHGHPGGDRSLMTMDLGLLVSNDGLHYREPIPDFQLVPALGEPDVPVGRGVCLSHGQGMVNWGAQTLLWYEVWGAGGVRLASWPRDRLGYFGAYDHPERESWLPSGLPAADLAPHFVTCPLRAAGETGVSLNLDGVGPAAEVRVEVLDAGFHPIPGLSGDACLPVRQAGLRQPVRWRDRHTLAGVTGAFRLQVTYAGQRPQDVKVYALYVG